MASARSRQRRADRCPQTLREADRDGIEVLCPFPRRAARGHHGVHQPGPVKVHRQAVLARPVPDRRNAFDGVDSPSAAIMRVLQPDESGPDVMNVVRADGVLDLIEGKQPEVSLKGTCGHARKPRDAPGLPDIDMRGCRTQEFISRAGVHADGNLVGHRSRRHEDRGLLSQQLRRAGLERVNRGVLAEDVIAHLGLSHRPAHRRGRPRHRVRPQINRRTVHERCLCGYSQVGLGCPSTGPLGHRLFSPLPRRSTRRWLDLHPRLINPSTMVRTGCFSKDSRINE